MDVKLFERLPNGNELVRIDDPEKRRGRRIEERDPSGKVVWKYEHAGLFSSAQRLPNGNTLVTTWNPDGLETDDWDGAEEIRPDGGVAWRLTAPSAKGRLFARRTGTDARFEQRRTVGRADRRRPPSW